MNRIQSARELNRAMVGNVRGSRDDRELVDSEYYPKDERAGFNFGKDLLRLVEALDINELSFLRGIDKVLYNRISKIERGDSD